MKKYLFPWIVLLMVSMGVSAQSPNLRGMYVNGFDNILGNAVKEDSLLNYLRDSSYNYMALYDLHALNFGSSTTVNTLASFISRARNQYGVQYVGAVGESINLFQSDIVPYNNSRTNPSEKFDVFNVEFEFWTTSSVQPGGYYCVQYLQQANCSCDTAGAFLYFKTLIRKVDSLATLAGAISETYVGWFNQGQGQFMANTLDRILLHAYRVDPSSVFGYSKTRLGYLGSTSRTVQVAPIFSSEPNFMGPWLNSHAQVGAWNQYLADFNADNSTWKPKISLQGYHWFTYSYMPKPAPGTGGSTYVPMVTASGATNFCSGGNVILTAEVGSGYRWSNGATTRSITVTTAGSYTCQVTSNGNTGTSVPVTVNVWNNPTVSVSTGSSSPSGVVLNGQATAGSGSVSSYQWLMNGVNISNATSVNFTATTNGNYALKVTNSNGCPTTSTALAVSIPSVYIPAITTSGATAFCSGGSVTLTAESGSAYVWSNGSTSRSITVSTAGNYTCTVTKNGSTGTSAAVQVTVWNNPTSSIQVGTATSSGVPLTVTATAGSGSISSFQWSLNQVAINGATASSLLATSSGTYLVAVNNSNGCSVTSAPVSVTVPTTFATCQLTTPTPINTVNITSNSAEMLWSALPSCDSLLFRIRKEGTNQYTYISFPYQGQTSFMLLGLDPNQRYSWRMRTKCGGSVSSYSNRLYFTTTNTGGINRNYDPIVVVRTLEEGIITYPNPVIHHVSVQVIAEEVSTGTLQLTDMSGRILQQKEVNLIEGENILRMELQGIPSGVYLLSTLYAEEVQTTRIIHME